MGQQHQSRDNYFKVSETLRFLLSCHALLARVPRYEINSCGRSADASDNKTVRSIECQLPKTSIDHVCRKHRFLATPCTLNQVLALKLAAVSRAFGLRHRPRLTQRPGSMRNFQAVPVGASSTFPAHCLSTWREVASARTRPCHGVARKYEPKRNNASATFAANKSGFRHAARQLQISAKYIQQNPLCRPAGRLHARIGNLPSLRPRRKPHEQKNGRESIYLDYRRVTSLIAPPPEPDFSEFLDALRAGKWDDAPRKWSSFFAIRTATTIVGADTDTKDVRILTIKGTDLSWPASASECQDRMVSNLVYFKRNYIILALVVTLLAGISKRAPLLSAAILAFATSAACTSNAMLGHISLAIEARLKRPPFYFNETRVAGVDRTVAIRALQALGGGLALVVCSNGILFERSIAALISALLWTLLLVMLHAMMRPITLGTALGALVDDLRSAKNGKELVKRVTVAAQGLGRWVSSELKKPVKLPQVITVIRGKEVEEAARAAAAAEQAARAGDEASDGAKSPKTPKVSWIWPWQQKANKKPKEGGSDEDSKPTQALPAPKGSAPA
eukprot:jgi/Mesvir1/14844/Mv05466-RA.1